MKKFRAADFTDAKPRIVKRTRAFGDRVYTWRCADATSVGWGTTPKDAYNTWRRNYRRRAEFYRKREQQIASTFARTGYH